MRVLAEPVTPTSGAAEGRPTARRRARAVATVEDIARTPFTAAELERAKNIWLRGFTQTLNDPQRVGLGLSEYIAIGDWRLGFERRDRIKAATLADVNRVAGAYFITSNRTLGSFIPSATPLRAPAPAKVDVAAVMKDFKGGEAVAAGEDFDVAPANIDRRTTIATLPGAAGIRTALLPKATRGAKVVALIALRLGDEKSPSAVAARRRRARACWRAAPSDARRESWRRRSRSCRPVERRRRRFGGRRSSRDDARQPRAVAGAGE
jgi:zinc protease